MKGRALGDPRNFEFHGFIPYWRCLWLFVLLMSWLQGEVLVSEEYFKVERNVASDFRGYLPSMK